jgi:hypothetical protein
MAGKKDVEGAKSGSKKDRRSKNQEKVMKLNLSANPADDVLLVWPCKFGNVLEC